MKPETFFLLYAQFILTNDARTSSIWLNVDFGLKTLNQFVLAELILNIEFCALKAFKKLFGFADQLLQRRITNFR